jgi:uncharacterized lipoprotein YddW (UPF0748 family)
VQRTVIVGVVGIAGGAIAAGQLARRRERRQRIREAATWRRRLAARSNRTRLRSAHTAALRKVAVTKIAKQAQVSRARNRARRRASAAKH